MIGLRSLRADLNMKYQMGDLQWAKHWAMAEAIYSHFMGQTLPAMDQPTFSKKGEKLLAAALDKTLRPASWLLPIELRLEKRGVAFVRASHEVLGTSAHR